MKRFTLFFAILFASIGIALAQQKVVKGVVISAEDNEPIIGASVFVKGNTKIGAATDIDGKFTLSVPADAKILVVSSVGMTNVEVKIQPNMKIMMKSDSKMLDDVVVVGYGSARKNASVVSSVAVVKAKDLEAKPVSNPFDAIQGKVSGLQVFSSSGEPSEISSVRLHGTGSLGAGSAPLYIVDGMPVSASTVMSMNSNDFATFQVLKDAAATSIYGARAANGVIYITTKKGASGDRAKVTVRGQYGVSNLANRSYYDSFMNSRELADFWLETKQFSQADLDKFLKKYPNDTNWADYYFMKNRPTYSTDVTVSGGAGRTNYYISGGTFSQQGLRYGSDYKKYTLRLNLNSGINDKITFGTNNSLTSDDYKTNPYDWNSPNGGLSMVALPMYTPYDADGKEYDRIPGWNRWSPRYLSEKNPTDNGSVTFNNASFLQIVPITGLTLRAQAGFEFSDFRSTSTRYPSFGGNLNNGTRSERFDRSITKTFTNTAEYKFDVASDHHFIALVGHEYNSYKYDRFNARGEGLANDNMVDLGLTTKEKTVESRTAEYAFLSYFGRLSYDYQSKYFLDLTYRNDASSRFGKNKRNGNFWSLGAMWSAKKENFLADVEWLSDAKLKFSMGSQGNADIGDYNSYALISKKGQYENGFGWGISTPGNPDLSWENQFTTTVGFEIGFFNKLNLNVEFYNRNTSSLLMDVPYPYYTGFIDANGRNNITENIGTYRNRGVDIKLNYDILQGKDGDGLSAYVNFNYNTDKMIKLFQGLDHWIIPNTGVCYVVGKPVMYFYPLFKGVNTDTGMSEWYLPGENLAVTTKDKVTSEFVDNLDQNTGIRRYAPINGGFGLSGSLKGFYMQADFAFTIGKHLIVNDAFFFENPNHWGRNFNQRKDVRDYWKKPGDVAKFPGFNKSRFTEFDSRMIQNASFMRMKTFTLGYNVPKSILSKQDVIKGAKVFFTGRNLLTFTKFEGPDPEIDSNLTLGANPNTKQVSVGVEINF
ncbi:SusC/RagA family TonB-linked outer membrane protein [Porphyromonas pogonae]|uniref:SusC/RagA family TonB-linked outer membrane protein n=1 Tax=Porphyromonas pogonae TaxID=867595 RepID=UPI002E78C434|nr:SusC/RagA family TonB-linked outer membrane protein [Porphyromonas pogonae]